MRAMTFFVALSTPGFAAQPLRGLAHALARRGADDLGAAEPAVLALVADDDLARHVLRRVGGRSEQGRPEGGGEEERRSMEVRGVGRGAHP